MDEIKLSGKIALITGASTGIGRSTAIEFARLGANLALVARNLDNLSETRRLCRTEDCLDTDIICIQADLEKEEEVERVAKETISHFKTLHILVNNAASLMDDTVETVDMTVYDKLMSLNVRSPLLLTKMMVPYLVQNKGSIVNVSSIAATRNFETLMTYSITKAAFEQFSHCLALDLAAKGVRVNTVTPGVIVTEIHRRSGMPEDKYAEFLERSKITHALGRAGRPDEVAKTIAFLASDASSFITAASIPVDGGRQAMCVV